MCVPLIETLLQGEVEIDEEVFLFCSCQLKETKVHPKSASPGASEFGIRSILCGIAVVSTCRGEIADGEFPWLGISPVWGGGGGYSRQELELVLI